MTARLDWADPAAVQQWLVGLRGKCDDVDAVVEDMFARRGARTLGPVTHREHYREARKAILQALAYALPDAEPESSGPNGGSAPGSARRWSAEREGALCAWVETEAVRRHVGTWLEYPCSDTRERARNALTRAGAPDPDKLLDTLQAIYLAQADEETARRFLLREPAPTTPPPGPANDRT